ncbi:RhoGAP-domain-containing protein [Pseudovirgaria hyperparasitica]|uniref:RhoGAP-domain-containing protein n=1 Tax=Pseudovirgaria hyperparasitica TaxID=470096 RepID=A0A6A6W8U1_9PEZI|nr:RhoGAP-domain-containing protein [Pseudovirgaria hyperparasitica]KAF2757501.1 RhoGAP-domain-containing protein [Pseudovirgaria hyperparasitica]
MDSREPISEANGDGPPRPSSSHAPGEDETSTIPLVQPTLVSDTSKAVDNVLFSDIGVNTLLNRLKQSIASAQDFAGFLKKRSSIEESHAQGLKKLYRSTHDAISSSNTRQGTYALNLDNATRLQDRMGDNGMQFALSLHQMHEDLTELSNTVEKGRKQWKAEGLANEKKVQDAESMMSKAKSKYDSLAEDLDRLKTGDKSSGKLFGLKGPKSSAQQEEDLQRKLQAADSDYSAKVKTAQDARQALISSQRPSAIKALLELIKECDSALSLQFQKYVAFNEKLILGNGILVAPIPGSEGQQVPPSMRDFANLVDNEKDLNSYILSHTSKVPAKSPDIKYEKHPVSARRRSRAMSWGNIINASKSLVQQSTSTGQRRASQSQPPQQSHNASPPQAPQSFAQSTNVQSSVSQPTPVSQDSPYRESPYQDNSYQPYQPQPQHQYQTPAHSADSPYGGPPQLNYPQTSTPQYPSYSSQQYPPPSQSGTMAQQASGVLSSNDDRGVFGRSLGDLYAESDNLAPVPIVVYQCIQAVEMYGLDVEGIYRIPGTSSHIDELEAVFNKAHNEHTQVDLRNPASFHHDINSVAGLLKRFFSKLNDPLFTRSRYQDFVKAARIDDEVVRRDTMHKIINELPDPNYATIRALVLHLNRIQDHASINRMSSSNLAICFAPTLMMGDIKEHHGPLADAGLQARVVETVLANTYQIFDED